MHAEYSCRNFVSLLTGVVLTRSQRVAYIVFRSVREISFYHAKHLISFANSLTVLYWLFKIATVMHAILNQRGPAYVNNINRDEYGRRDIRSSTTNAAVVVRTRTQFRKRAFSVCGPSVWNQIPPHIRNLHSALAFRKALKTFVFGNHLDTV